MGLGFATAVGAFGTAFTLASQYEVLPITIYNEFTNYANFALAASLKSGSALAGTTSTSRYMPLRTRCL